MNASNPHFRFALVLTFALTLAIGGTGMARSAEAREQLRIRITFGHRAPERTSFTPRLVAGSPGLEVVSSTQMLTVGAGFVDAVMAQVSWKKPD